MNDKMREEFEARFPIPMYVFWHDETQHYMSHGNPLGCLTYRGRWEGWQASRESLVIELPEKDPAGSGGGDCGDGRPSEEQYVAAHCNIVLAQCRAAIEAAGLKVAP